MVNHVDLLEDVVLGLVVAWTTAAALYVGWRAGRAARRRAPAIGRGDRSVLEGVEAQREAVAGFPVPINDWNQRLATEGARCARHGSSAAVVAIRLDQRSESRGRRSEPGVQVTEGVAAALSRRARASDSTCVTQDGTIRTLLVETTEAGAHRFADRMTTELATGPELGSVHIVAAWAAMAPGRDLRAADRLAAARLRGATSGWLRSLAVLRTADVALNGADLDGDATETRGSVD